MQHRLLMRYNFSYLVAIAIVMGLLLGISSVWILPSFLFAGLGGIIYVVVAWLWPEMALLSILVLTSTIFDTNLLPSIPIGIGHILIPDILVVILVGIIILRVTVESKSYLIHTPLDIPLLLFYGTALLSTFIAIYNSTVTFNQSLGELRVVNFYLVFFAVTNLVRNEKQLRRLFGGFIFLTVFVALAMITQYVLGPSVPILPGRVETLSTAGRVSSDIARILPPGQSLVMSGFVLLAVQMLFNKKPSRFTVNLIQLGIVGFGVLLTFNRNFWAGIGLALLLVGLLVSLRDKIAYVQMISLVILIGALAFSPLLMLKDKNVEKFIGGVTARMSTLFNPDTKEESSLQYRNIENEYAYAQITSHPLLGLGLGANYRVRDRRLDPDPTNVDNNYIHHGHLYVILKTGLIGYLFLMWFLLFFVKRGIQYWNQISDVIFKGTLLSFTVVIVGILAAAIVNPIFMQNSWTPVLAIMPAMGEVIIRMRRNQQFDSLPSDKLNLA